MGADAALSALVPEEDSSLHPATPQAGAADKASSPAPPQPHAAPPAPVLAQASPVVLPGNETSAGLLATAAAQATQSGAAQAAQQASQQGAAPELVPQSPHHARIAAEAAPQIVLRLADAAGKGQQTVSVELTPPELGRVELRLTFREGQVHQVVMAAERSDTFEALRQDRQSLLQQMEQAGLQLGQSGLDLQHGALPRQDTETAEEQAFRLAQAAQERAGDLSAEAETPPRPASDSLIDIIA
ncbi:flagellar hook-length control protein FliK [Roseomonas sp. GC11]|nr:flagellar hook-length control protein FliK [Roseomonas sp. GC11]